MAPFRCVFLLSLFPVLFISSALGDPIQTNHHHQNHQHHGSMHHHRNAGSPRHNTQYPHSRHNHDSSLLRRESRLHGYHSLSHTSTIPTSTTTSREGLRTSASTSYVRSRNERLNAVIEPSVSRNTIYNAMVHQEPQPQKQIIHQQRENLMQVYSNANLATTPPSVYNKFQPGRRVCSRISETTSLPLHQRSRLPRMVYTDSPFGFQCCPGWTQLTRLSFGCNKPVCSVPCQNGGVCSSPGKCTCPKGFTGNYCQIDVDECVTEKPCDQICRNVPGTYECYCRSGYELQADRQSCRKNDSDGTALEARDLEEDYEETTTTTTRRPILRDTENEVGDARDENNYEELLQRLIKLEKQVAKGKEREIEANQMTSRIASAIDSINEIRRSIQNMQLMQLEIYELRNKVKLYEFETRKIQHLTNRVIDLENRLRLRCRSGVYLNSGSTTF